MSWYPVGPDQVMAPKAAWRRLSRRNEGGALGAVFSIAVGAREGDLTVVVRRVGGSSVLRSDDDGRSWRCVSDDLNREEPSAEFYCVAVRPGLPAVIFLGTSTGVRISTDGGATWSIRGDAGGKVLSLLVDEAASGATWDTTVLYAGTDRGVSVSTDGGRIWRLDAIGHVTSLAAHLPRTGARRFLAGVIGPGLMSADAVGDGAAAWRTLVGPGAEAGLPASVPAGWVYTALVGIHPRQPERAYALLIVLQAYNLTAARVQGLFVSVSERLVAGRRERTWEERALIGPPPDVPGSPFPKPGLDYSLDGSSLLVAPEYTGADMNDVLFCTGATNPWRALQGGRTYQYVTGAASLSHVDLRSLALFPPATAYYDGVPPGAAHPRVYLGSDGGLAASRRLTDPAYDVAANTTSPAGFNEGEAIDSDNGAPENLSHGFAAVAGLQLGHTGDPRDTSALSTVGYLSTLDTGTARLLTSRVGRNVGGGDAGPTRAAATSDGVRIWQNASAYAGWRLWPQWNFVTYLDTDGSRPGDFRRIATDVGQPTGSTSNLLRDTPDAFFTGIVTRESFFTITNASPATRDPRSVVFTVSPGAPGVPPIRQYERVWIGPNPDTSEEVYVEAVTDGSFTAGSKLAHAAGEPVYVRRYAAARVAGATATRLGQTFPTANLRLCRLARAGDFLYAASADQRLWRLPLSTATSTTPWVELADRPSGLAARPLDDYDGLFYSGLEIQPAAPIIAALVTAADGAVYALLSGTAADGGGTSTALWRIDGGAWVAERCTPPATAATPQGVSGGAAVAHPDLANVLYWSRGHRLFEVRRTSGEWTWTDLTENLPGQEIHDLCIANLARPGEPPRYLLRALAALRGVWERELGEPPRGPHLFFFRKHIFDRGWTGQVADGIENPFRVGERAWHWQSPDIKVDAPERDSMRRLFYQTEPESLQPKPGEFAWIRDRSDSAPAGQPLRVFVQVNNRGNLRSGEVKVWALSCLWSGRLPELPRTEDPATMAHGPFWSRFHPDGSLDVTLERGGPWTPLTPRTTPAMNWFPVANVSAESPAIAAFDLPAGAVGDHRCILVFVHGAEALLNGTGLSTSPDEAVLNHPQIGQRNVSIGDPLPPDPNARGFVPVGDRSTTGPGGTGAFEIVRYIQFHNPDKSSVTASLRFEAAALPSGLQLSFRLSRNASPSTIEGAAPRSPTRVKWITRLLGWLSALLRALARMLGLPAAPPKAAARRLPLSDTWFEAKPRSTVTVRDVTISPGDHVAAEIVVRPIADLEPGSEHRLDILQLVKDQPVGGATLLLPVAGERKPEPAPRIDEDEREIAGRFEARLSPKKKPGTEPPPP